MAFYGRLGARHNMKVYIVTKYIEANNAKDAIRREKNYPVDDVYIEQTSKTDFIHSLSNKKCTPTGFNNLSSKKRVIE